MTAEQIQTMIAAGLSCQHLTVDHCPGGQEIGQRCEFGKAVGDQFLAARPQGEGPGAMDQLAPDPVPFPLRNEVLGVERGRSRLGNRSDLTINFFSRVITNSGVDS